MNKQTNRDSGILLADEQENQLSVENIFKAVGRLEKNNERERLSLAAWGET